METLLVIQTASLSAKRKAILDGIVRGASEVGWRVQAIETVPSQAQLERLVRFWNPCGLVVECSGGSVSYRAPSNVPTVFVDQDPSCPARPRAGNSPTPCVRNDSAYIAELVAREFLSLGLRHFAFVGWHTPIYWCEEKRESFLKVLALHGAGAAVFTPTRRDATSQIAFQKRLRKWLKSLPKPCGLFAINDTIAEPVLAAAEAEHISVPQDLAVISVDNDETICERTTPTLTSVRPGFAEIGYRAVQLLAAGGRPPALTVIRPAGLVRRQSSRLLKRTDAEVDAALELIRREACGGLKAATVLARFACSRRLAEKRFFSATGTSVLKAIHQVRLARAQELLANPDIPVKVVANRCGWNSDIIFRRIYTAAFGHPPRR